MADLTFTTIEESARHFLNISRDEYAACNYVQTWAAYPSSKTPGFCNRTRGQMAAFIGISERGMQKMLSRLEGMDLIKRASQSQFLYRITEKWFEVVVAAKDQRTGEQSSRQGVNKVPAWGEQSSRQGGNKVPTHKELNKEVYKTTTKEKIDVAVFDPEVNALIVDSLGFKADAFPPTPIAPPPAPQSYGEWMRSDPPAPRRFEAFDIDKEERMFLGAEDAMERYARETGTPRDKMYFGFQDAVKAFTADQKTTGYNYNNAIDYRKHFFNLVRRKAEIARNVQRAQPGASSAQSNSPVPTNIRRL